MIEKKGVQSKIQELVKTYSEVFKPEYLAVVNHLKEKRKSANKMGSVKGDHVLQHAMFEIPATLHTLLNTRLNKEEWEYYISKEGTRWFALKFKQFASFE